MKPIAGMKMPRLMYGTAWKKEATKQLTQMAIASGFLGIDTANQLKHYNEALVGEALKENYAKGFKRENFFLQTKFTAIDGQDHRLPYDPSSPIERQVEQSFQSSLEHLHTDYIDSYLLHGPSTSQGLAHEDWEAWSAIENLHKKEKAKLIGVSNVTLEQLQLLYEKATVKPMIVQNRCYAIRNWDMGVRAFCKAQGIVYQGFSLLTANIPYLQLPIVREIAQKNKLTIPQVIFCFARQLDIVCLTGTTDETHMRQDLDSLQHELSNRELEILLSIRSLL